MTIDHLHISSILGSVPVDLRTENAELRAEIERLRAALQRVWDEWSESPNATDPDAEGYETLQVVRKALKVTE